MPVPTRHHADRARPSFRSLFDAELPYVLRSLLRLGVADRDVEDVAQDVFVAVHRRFDEYDPERPVRPWLFSFCVRFAANHRRLARHGTDLPGRALEERHAAASGNPHEGAVRRERRALLLRALEALPFERRTVLVMHDVDGFTAPVVAATLDVPLNTVYSRLRVARRELQAAIDELKGGGR